MTNNSSGGGYQEKGRGEMDAVAHGQVAAEMTNFGSRLKRLRHGSFSSDGSEWCFRDADGENIMEAHIWMSSSEGKPDALIFSNKHHDKEDWERDIRSVMERYGIERVKILSDIP